MTSKNQSAKTQATSEKSEGVVKVEPTVEPASGEPKNDPAVTGVMTPEDIAPRMGKTLEEFNAEKAAEQPVDALSASKKGDWVTFSNGRSVNRQNVAWTETVAPDHGAPGYLRVHFLGGETLRLDAEDPAEFQKKYF